ncbi:ribosomal S3Ae family protein [Ancylostoma ceylanicum]|uniref:Small ribosomal subunit protein eS1 n=2 Tax=Ancylostoma TaxID=29169 RepID=A0A0D6LS73_9BILA|nr:ribosomal S3Ae family protein [Ancylostoma ceylanicum]RCN48741.1 ribosomal S3Ae family protein [Ancylostoma caninum]
MAVGKNNNKMGKKGGKKKAVDPFARKEWYDIKAPSMFYNRQVGKTLINRTQGTKIASEGLKGRVFEVSLADLNDSEADFRKFKLVCEDVQGKNVLTNFHAMSMTRDKLCSIVKKWHTLIEANGVFKTTDGYVLHLFCIGFTKRSPNQVKKTTYTKASKVRKIRARMLELMKKEVSGCDLKEVCSKLIPDSIGKDIEKACHGLYPLQDVYIRKVKILKKPRLDIGRLMEMHGDSVTVGADGEKVDRPDDYEPPVQETV